MHFQWLKTGWASSESWNMASTICWKYDLPNISVIFTSTITDNAKSVFTLSPTWIFISLTCPKCICHRPAFWAELTEIQAQGWKRQMHCNSSGSFKHLMNKTRTLALAEEGRREGREEGKGREGRRKGEPEDYCWHPVSVTMQFSNLSGRQESHSTPLRRVRKQPIPLNIY